MPRRRHRSAAPKNIHQQQISQSSVSVDQFVTERIVWPGASDQRLKKITFCVVSRIIGQELPYLGSFIRHYASLGVASIYLFCNMIDDHARIVAYLRSLRVPGVSMGLHTWKNEVGANKELRDTGLVNLLEEDWVIGVDLDEYLVLPSGCSLQSLLSKHVSYGYRLRWFVVVDDAMHHTLLPPYHGFEVSQGKWMAKRTELNAVGLHSVFWRNMTHIDARKLPFGGSLIHFWGRSFLDQATKGVAQRGMTFLKGCEGLNKTVDMIASGRVPERLRMLAYFANRRTTRVVNASKPLLVVDHALERDIAGHLFGKDMNTSGVLVSQLHHIYLRFKARLFKRMSAQKSEELDFFDNNLVPLKLWLNTTVAEFGM